MAVLITKESPVRIDRQCELLGLPRSSYYRLLQPVPACSEEEQELVDALVRLRLRYPCYGYRRIRVELCKTHGPVNRKRVLRLMRLHGLLVVPRRRFVYTTNSKHSYLVYENLVKNLSPIRPNTVWVSDITYIAYGNNRFAYLAVILDACSRRVIGWKVSRHVDAALTVDALKMALATRPVPEGLIHHSDRGVQYACHAYTDLLKEHGIRMSMSAPGNPYENAKAESFMKTIKTEEVYRNEYDTFEEVERWVGSYIENTYNTTRLHSAINYTSPMLYEQQLLNQYQQQAITLHTKLTVSL